jgi:transcriptional regulator with XRE-family HTH domain
MSESGRYIMYGMAPSDLGLRIRRARERKRWDQVRLAAELGVSVRSVSRWENGTPPRSSIGALEAVLGISLSEEQEPDSPRNVFEERLLQELPPERAWAYIRAHRAVMEQQGSASERAG